MDIILQFKEWLVEYVGDLDFRITAYILRTGFILVFSSSVLFFTFMHGLRSIFFQFLWMIITIATSFDEYPFNLMFRLRGEQLTIAVMISFMCMIFLPRMLGFLLVPKLGYQLLLTKLFHFLIWSLFIIQILIVYLR